jgi:predicted ATPase
MTCSVRCLFHNFNHFTGADRESVELIKSVLEDSKDALLIVGAYRDNEVSETHYVKRVINEIKQKEQVRVTELSLRPLEIGTVYNWLSDTFNRNSDA